VFCTRISQYQIWNTAHLTSTPINQSINPVRELKLDKGGFFYQNMLQFKNTSRTWCSSVSSFSVWLKKNFYKSGWFPPLSYFSKGGITRAIVF
jgi:predicted component of type VI protein secretion system